MLRYSYNNIVINITNVIILEFLSAHFTSNRSATILPFLT